MISIGSHKNCSFQYDLNIAFSSVKFFILKLRWSLNLRMILNVGPGKALFCDDGHTC